MIPPTNRVWRSSNPLGTVVDGEVVLMSTARGRYYGLDIIASDIWGRLAAPITLSELCAGLHRDYDGSAEAIASDVIALLELLLSEGLIETGP